MKPLNAALPLLLLPALSTAAAQATVQTHSIIVNPVKSSLKVNVRTNRDPSGNAIPGYTPGNHLEFYTRVNQDAYVYLFNVDAAGQVQLLAENGLQAKGNFVKANTTRVFPKKGQKSTFLLTLPAGTNTVLALASKTPLNVQQIAQFAANQETARVNATGREGLAQALSIVVRPVQPEAWTTATARYSITHRRLGRLPTLDPQTLKTQVAFDHDARLSEIFAAYADSLRARGYQPLSAQYGSLEVTSVFAPDGHDKGQVNLNIKQVGQHFFVDLKRRN